MKRLLVLSIVISFTAMAWVAGQEGGWLSYSVPASAKAKLAHTARYEVLQKGNERQIRVIGGHGEEQAELTLVTGEDGAQAIALKTLDGTMLDIKVGPEIRWVEIADRTTGSSGRAAFDYNAKKFKKDETFLALETSRASEVKLALEAAATVVAYNRQLLQKQMARQGYQSFQVLQASTPSKKRPDAVTTMMGPFCNGPRCRGNSYGLSLSACCDAAAQDAHNCCGMNQYCIGCCRIGECDAYCAVGDYFCAICGVTGTMCSSMPQTCLEDWHCPWGYVCVSPGVCMQGW